MKRPMMDVTTNSTKIMRMKNGMADVMYAGYPPEVQTVRFQGSEKTKKLTNTSFDDVDCSCSSSIIARI